MRRKKELSPKKPIAPFSPIQPYEDLLSDSYTETVYLEFPQDIRCRLNNIFEELRKCNSGMNYSDGDVYINMTPGYEGCDISFSFEKLVKKNNQRIKDDRAAYDRQKKNYEKYQQDLVKYNEDMKVWQNGEKEREIKKLEKKLEELKSK